MKRRASGVDRLVLAVVMLGFGCACARGVELGAALDENGIVGISLRLHGLHPVERVELYRSSSRLGPGVPDTIASPVTVFCFPGTAAGEQLVDSMVAHNVVYYYRARLMLEDGRELWSGADSVRVPDVGIGRITGSSLLIDKTHFFLEVRDGGQMKKRYPVALGGKPRNRKLHMDRASTPEGIYEITSEQPAATFYKAFDLSYPNDMDRARYAHAKEAGLMKKRWGDYPLIGGEIQIHGEGIESNWTWGCIALRNEDMDELFEHDRVGKGMPVIIVGRGITREDVRSIQDYRTESELKAIQRRLKALGYYKRKPDGVVGSGTRLALGRFQQANDLPPTCDFDAGTVRLLEQQ